MASRYHKGVGGESSGTELAWGRNDSCEAARTSVGGRHRVQVPFPSLNLAVLCTAD